MPGKLIEPHLIEQLNQDGTVNQLVSMGDRIRDLDAYGPIVFRYEIAADGSSGLTAVTVPFACEVIDVMLIAKATNASGTVIVRKATSAITDAIVAAVDTTVGRAGTIDETYTTMAKGDTITVITNGAADRAEVFITVLKV